MKVELLKYMEDGITIRKIDKGYEVFTIKTHHFKISALSELTEYRFIQAIEDLKKREELENKMFEIVNKK